MKRLENNNINILKGRVEFAVYKEQDVEEYINNPFIESLPPIFSEDEIIDRFYNIPIFSEDYKTKSKNIKFHIVNRVKEYSQVLPIHSLIENKLSMIIRRGYLARNPLDTNYFKNLNVLNSLKEDVNVSTEDIDYKMKYMRSTADCLTIIGLSGMGKTTAVERLLLMYPQVIKHSFYKNNHFTRTQIVWLKIDCPYDGNLSTLCKSFFKAIDDILGTKYLYKFGYASKVTSTLMLSMTQLASLYGIGVLVIDEIQHLINTKNSTDEMMNFFVTLSNTVGIPTILIGTPKAEKIFSGNFRQARRASSDGCIVWDRMKYDSVEWQILINRLWEMQCLEEYTPLTEKLNKTFYDQTQGIVSVLINLFILVQERALLNEKEKITVKLIEETANEDLKLLKPLLNALKNNKKSDIAKYDDIVLDYESISQNIYNKIEIVERMNVLYKENIENIDNIRKNRVENLAIEIKSINITPYLSDKEILNEVTKEVERNPYNISLDELKGKCIKRVLDVNEKKYVRSNTPKVKNTNIHGLIKLYDSAIKEKIHPYDKFKEAGYIKNPLDDLIC